MRRKNGTIAVVLLLGALAAALGCGNATTQAKTDNTSSTIPAPNASLTTPAPPSPTTEDFVGISSNASLSLNGLKLSLSLNSTTFQLGEEVSIVIDEQNTLPVENKVLASQSWPLEGLSLGPCGTINYPFGIAIFQGNYSAADISTAKRLMLYDPGATYHCPAMIAGITAYDFQPTSDMASIFDSYDPDPFGPTQIISEVSAKGYWIGSPAATLTNFPPGVYTVVAGDEWGTTGSASFRCRRSDSPAISVGSALLRWPSIRHSHRAGAPIVFCAAGPLAW